MSVLSDLWALLYLFRWRAHRRPCVRPGLVELRSVCSGHCASAGEVGCGRRCPSESGLWESSALCPGCAARTRCPVPEQRSLYTVKATAAVYLTHLHTITHTAARTFLELRGWGVGSFKISQGDLPSILFLLYCIGWTKKLFDKTLQLLIILE